MKKTLSICLSLFISSTILAQQKTTVIVNADQGKFQIDRNIYGQFSEHLGRSIYEGLWVGENSPIPNINGVRKDIIDALKHIRIPNLRWPGGCFADEYHWMDGIGPREQRAKMVNPIGGELLKITALEHTSF